MSDNLKIRRFYLQRNDDETGLSGTGRIADGVMFQDGVCVLRWNSGTPSTTIYNTIDNLMYLHRHDGKTVLKWIDKPICCFLDDEDGSCKFESGRNNCFIMCDDRDNCGQRNRRII